MKGDWLRSGVLVGLMLAPAAALGCGREKPCPDLSEFWPVIARHATVSQLAGWLKEGAAVAVDANAPELRQAQGVIPGAVMLRSSSDYELSELPAAKGTLLVFYCGDERCAAAEQAAARALAGGYSNVAVLPAGIVGWKAAGQPSVKAPEGC